MGLTNYTISFENGVATGPVTLPVGTYKLISTTIPGYSDGTIAQFEVTPTTTSLSLEIVAQGGLTVSVEDDLGKPITAGTLQLSNSTGATKYGTALPITEGSVSFPNVPYQEDGINFYLLQDGSDDKHDPIAAPQAVSMTQKAQTETVSNARKESAVNFALADPNYDSMTPLTGNVVVEG